MYALTEKRFIIAEPILKKYQAKLRADGEFDSITFEHELRQALKLGLRESESIFMQVFKKHPKYRRVAAYYMQNSDAPGPRAAFKPLLAKLYGMPTYNSAQRELKQQKYWARKA